MIKERVGRENVQEKAQEIDLKIKGLNRKIKRAKNTKKNSDPERLQPLERKLNDLKIEQLILNHILSQMRISSENTRSY